MAIIVSWIATALKALNRRPLTAAGKGMRSHENRRTPVKCAFQVRSETEILPC